MNHSNKTNLTYSPCLLLLICLRIVGKIWKMIRTRWNISLTMKARIQAAVGLIPPWPEVCLCGFYHLSMIQSHLCIYVHKNKTSQRSQIISVSTDTASETSLMASDTDWRLWTTTARTTRHRRQEHMTYFHSSLSGLRFWSSPTRGDYANQNPDSWASSICLFMSSAGASCLAC